MAKKVKIPNIEINGNVKNKYIDDEDHELRFSFVDFHLMPINLSGEFNNFYKDSEEYIRKSSIILDKALPLLSSEKESIFVGDHEKREALHLHKVLNKRHAIEKILSSYGFNERRIDNIFEGEEVYQLEVPYENGSTRLIFYRIENCIYFLFVDPNHHIFLDQSKVKASGSLFYEFCPIYEAQKCQRMDMLHTCFAFDYLDEEKYYATYGYTYKP